MTGEPMTTTDPMATADRILITRRAWFWAGALAVVSTVPGVVGTYVQSFPVVGWIAPVLLAVALLLLAFGPDSVVARRPLGVTALVVLALWPLISRVVDAFFLRMIATGPYAVASAVSSSFGYVESAVGILAGIVVVVQIWRVGVVPASLRWVPLIVFALWVAPDVLMSAAYVTWPASAQTVSAQTSLFVVGALVAAATALGTLIFGTSAIVAATQPRPIATARS
jgi:hypothetical protein